MDLCQNTIIMKKIENLTTHEEAEDVARQNLYCSRSSTWQKIFCFLRFVLLLLLFVFLLSVLFLLLLSVFPTNLASALHPRGPVAKRDGGGDFPPRREARSA